MQTAVVLFSKRGGDQIHFLFALEDTTLMSVLTLPFCRLLKEEECNILQNLSREEFREFRTLVIDMVLATDMSFHFQQLKNMKNLLTLAEPRWGLIKVKLYLNFIYASWMILCILVEWKSLLWRYSRTGRQIFDEYIFFNVSACFGREWCFLVVMGINGEHGNCLKLVVSRNVSSRIYYFLILN